MRDLVILFVHLIVTVVRLARPGGLRSVVASRCSSDINCGSSIAAASVHPTCAPRIVLSPVCALFSCGPTRVLRSASVLKTSTLLYLHNLLKKRKYCLLFTPKRRRRPGPHGPKKELIDAVAAMKRRNP